MNANFSMVSGDGKILEIEAVGPDGTPYDLSNHTARWGLFRPTGEKMIEKSSGNGIVANAGAIRITLAPDDTSGLEGYYRHEVEIRDAAGVPTTILQGSVTILRGLL